MIVAWVRGLVGQLGFTIMLVLAAVGAMVLAYGGARMVSRCDGYDASSLVLSEQKAEEMHRLSKDLVVLASDLFERRSTEEGETPLEQWVQERFTPRANDLRRRMLAVTSLPEHAISGLLAALDRLSAMAAQPHREELSDAAASAVLDAITTVENYLSTNEILEGTLPSLDALESGMPRQ